MSGKDHLSRVQFGMGNDYEHSWYEGSPESPTESTIDFDTGQSPADVELFSRNFADILQQTGAEEGVAGLKRVMFHTHDPESGRYFPRTQQMHVPAPFTSDVESSEAQVILHELGHHNDLRSRLAWSDFVGGPEYEAAADDWAVSKGGSRVYGPGGSR